MQVLWPGQTGERRERVITALREGRLVPQALPFTTHTESLELEDLVRGFRFSSEAAILAGMPLPTGAKMTDVPEHTWLLPTLLTHAGVNFLHLGCNSASAVPQVPLLFWWEGPDGSRLLTMYNPDYGSSLRPPAGWPYRTWLYMWMTGDNHGPPNPDEVKKLFEHASKRTAGSEGALWPAFGFLQRDSFRENRPAGGARRHAGYLDPWYFDDAG